MAFGYCKESLKAVGERLVGAKYPEIALLAVQLHHIAQERPEYMGIADTRRTRRRHLGRILAEIRHAQVAQQHATVGVGIRAHTPLTVGRQFGELWL